MHERLERDEEARNNIDSLAKVRVVAKIECLDTAVKYSSTLNRVSLVLQFWRARALNPGVAERLGYHDIQKSEDR
jgi:hypothetical protein